MEKVLCVDDDANILAAYQRQLRRRFKIEAALGSQAALSKIRQNGPYAVIVADLNMPGMNGIELLSEVRLRTPETVRMMLTGNADLHTAIDAVNEGNIFRFLTKPCHPETFARALEAGVRQHRLIRAERELLERTLNGSVRVLTEILSVVDPDSFGKAQLLQERIRMLSVAAGAENTWEVEAAAMLSQIGLVTIPPDVLRKTRNGGDLSAVEEEMISRVPEIGRKLLSNIPRLEDVAQIVLYQSKRFDGSGFPEDSVAGERIPLGARILKVVTDLSELESGRTRPPEALAIMNRRKGWYDPALLVLAGEQLLPQHPSEVAERKPMALSVKELQPGLILLSDLATSDGLLLLSAGHRITGTFLERIRNISILTKIREPILVDCESP